MNRVVNLLLAEDSEDDARIVVRVLERGGFEVRYEHIKTAVAMEAALRRQSWDAVISDYNMPGFSDIPGFSGLDALRIVRATGLDIPFILISGYAGEEIAVNALKAGVGDYVLKKNLSRLPLVLERELREAATRAEHRQIQRHLIESEQRYREMFSANPQPMWVFDPETLRFLSVNDAAIAHYGWSREEFLAMKIGDIRPAEEEQRLRTQVGRERNQDSVNAGLCKHRKKNGAIIDVEVTSHIVDFGGRRAQVVLAHDVTKRKRGEELLRAAEEQYRGLVEQSIAGIYIIQDGKFAYINPRFAEIRGYGSAQEMVGLDPMLLIAEKDRGAVAEKVRQLLADEKRSVDYSFTAMRKDGSTLEAGVHSSRATYRGRPAIIGMMQDISEKTRAEEQIKRYIAQLENAFMQSVGVATALSEMRDPYTAGHERRVAEIAVAIGTELGLDARRTEGLRVAGYLHDVGKMIIPSEILSKPGKLSAVEFQLIQGHAQASYDVLKDVEFPWPVAQIALQHHERMDGSGYPQHLKGEAILLEARIMAVADVVEAMSSHRPYRPGLGIDKALAEIERGRATVYDADAADACLRLFREKGYTIPA